MPGGSPPHRPGTLPSNPLFRGTAPRPSASPAPSHLHSLLPKDALKFGTFRGHPSDKSSAADFLFRAETVLEFFPDVPGPSKIKLLLASFPSDSPAGAWYVSEYRKFHTFDAFKAAFLSRFGVSRSERLLLRQQFERFRQRDSDSVTTYYTAFLNLVTQIKLNGHEYDELDLIAKFVGGLKARLHSDVISEQLRADREFSLAEIAKIAENCERSARSTSNRNTNSNAHDTPSAKPQLNAFQQKQWCVFHKTSSHSTDNCQKVKALKKAGKWRGSTKSQDN